MLAGRRVRGSKAAREKLASRETSLVKNQRSDPREFGPRERLVLVSGQLPQPAAPSVLGFLRSIASWRPTRARLRRDKRLGFCGVDSHSWRLRMFQSA